MGWLTQSNRVAIEVPDILSDPFEFLNCQSISIVAKVIDKSVNKRS